MNLNNIKRALDYGSGSVLHVDLWKKVFSVADLYFGDISSVALEKEKKSIGVQKRSDFVEYRNENLNHPRSMP